MQSTIGRLGTAGLAVLWICLIPLAIAQSAADRDPSAGSSQQTADIREDQIRRVGGSVSPPWVISKVDPEFSEQARAEKFMGTVVVGLIVDTNGVPQNLHVIRGVGHGLDEKALEAIRQYRFRPAMENGKPVPVRVNVEINFRIKDTPAPLAR